MSELARIELADERDESVTVAAVGEIDASNADHVLAAFEAALTAPLLTIDLTRLDYLDSAGVRTLFALAETAIRRGAELLVVAPVDSHVRRVLVHSGMEGVLQLAAPVPRPD